MSFPITIGRHQGLVLSSFSFFLQVSITLILFALVMDERTKSIQEKVSWGMLFADDIVLEDEL